MVLIVRINEPKDRAFYNRTYGYKIFPKGLKVEVCPIHVFENVRLNICRCQ